MLTFHFALFRALVPSASTMNSNPLASRPSGGMCRDHAGLGFLEESRDLINELCREYRLEGCTVAGIARGYDPAC